MWATRSLGASGTLAATPPKDIRTSFPSIVCSTDRLRSPTQLLERGFKGVVPLAREIDLALGTGGDTLSR